MRYRQRNDQIAKRNVSTTFLPRPEMEAPATVEMSRRTEMEAPATVETDTYSQLHEQAQNESCHALSRTKKIK
ncbi:hypothetical protein NC653_022161 [Populus alba x Populus x berolinensis]|uniref:Uncharacterized protein n=1 Tax=Populus alba x Populus x berolinensis TaxID=444605 RepID=A0AAD6QFM6_9ROSI|nr:hypothetical protein NC653_022031 [Populus alba x Populus x berolinensis]KAJ6989496.1 hypothetical protein NC653_022156 [Populus alba x Populus x berolinensis]KAJ6989502.1 hypothetical protein NC653_022161 [Populus alba x Populus x berolinensis]